MLYARARLIRALAGFQLPKGSVLRDEENLVDANLGRRPVSDTLLSRRRAF